jgi:hypothetical protein
MRRWIIAFLGAWVICLAGMHGAWLAGLTLKCVFVAGCFEQLNLERVVAAVNFKSVLVRGTLAAIVITAIACMKRRS